MSPILSREVRFHYPGNALFSQWIFVLAAEKNNRGGKGSENGA